jgi:hypothetical protein
MLGLHLLRERRKEKERKNLLIAFMLQKNKNFKEETFHSSLQAFRLSASSVGRANESEM